MTHQPVKGPVHRLLAAAIRAGSFPGCVAGWCSTDRGSVAIQAEGVTHIGNESKETNADTWFDLASLTKPLVVTTLFLLARRGGDIDIDSEVGGFFPNVGPFSNVTLGNLLTHTGGLPGWSPLYASGFDPDDIVSAIGRLQPIGPPGKAVQYSCPGFILLGKILERVFGMTLAQAFDGLVVEPLGLSRDLSFNPSLDSVTVAGGAAKPDAEADLLRQLALDPSTIPAWRLGQVDDGNARFLGGIAGNAGLFGTVNGVVQLSREYLQDGGVLLNSTEAAFASVCRTSSPSQLRGLGWQIAGSPECSAGSRLSPTSVGHVGFTGGSVWIDRENNRVMALLSNRHHPGHRATDLHPLRRRFNTLVSELSTDQSIG